MPAFFRFAWSLFVYYFQVLLFTPASDAQLDKFLADAAQSRLSYAEVGATLVSSRKPTTSTTIAFYWAKAKHFSRAAMAIRDWKMFDVAWVRVYPAAPQIRTGENVAVIARWFNLYFVNACRIVDTIHEHVPVQRYGFVYGALHDHAEPGEERFTVEWDRHTDEVWYDLLAFSRPNQFLARIGYPFARRLQKKFASDSKAAMVRAVGTPAS